MGYKMKLSKLLGLAFMFWAVNAQALVVYESQDKASTMSIFGRLEAGVYNQFAKEQEKDNGKATIEGGARLGLSGSYSVATNVKAIAFAEWEVASQTKEDGKFDTRYAFVGMDFSHFGVLVVGQGDTAQYITVGFVDVFENFGAEATDYWTLGGRQEGQLMYSASVGNYTLTASFQAPNDNMGTYYDHDVGLKHELNVDYGFAVGINYNWTEGFLKDTAIALSFADYELIDDPIGDKHEFNAALSYGYLNEGLYTALNYSRISYRHEDHHLTGFDLVGVYAFYCGVGFMLGYGHLGYKFDRSIESYALAQLSYNFNDYLRLVAESKIGVGDIDYPVKPTHQHDKYFVSLLYSF